MTLKILITSTSLIDSPGAHHEILKATGYEIVAARGPFSEAELLPQFGDGNQIDGIICGEDSLTAAVLERARPRLRVISKYGVGLDKIDLEAAQRLGIHVTNTPGVNHHTVTEHTFGLLLSLVRRIPNEAAIVHRGEWRRLTGRELFTKRIAVIGFGRVGREVATRALAFGMNVSVYNTSWSSVHSEHLELLQSTFTEKLFPEHCPSIVRVTDDDEILRTSDFVTLHMNLTKQNNHFLNRSRLATCKRGAFIINVSRGALIDEEALSAALRSGHIAGYGADVLETEPIQPDCPLRGLPNVIITPHIGSRTYESVVRQGIAAIENVKTVLG